MFSIVYVVLAILSLSFLIFIHELGHYFMARRVGMRVEVFSIGFGQPIMSWDRDGVKWQICWILFGGYVKIAGMAPEGDQDPYAIEDGFFGKRPLDRIKVAAAGPIVNLVFALLVFTMIWAWGGREKNFAEYTPKIGWIDEQSELFAKGIRPGDEISAYDDTPFTGGRDHLLIGLIGGNEVKVQGNRVDYTTGKKTPFQETIKQYPHPNIQGIDLRSTGVMLPASYVIAGDGLENQTIEAGDRIFWADGEVIFSLQHLSDVLNDGRALLTVQRGQETFLRRVPRIEVQELRPDAEFREEMNDWQYDASIKGRYRDLKMIPYNLNHSGVVEGQMRFIDEEQGVKAFPEHLFTSLDEALQTGDQVIAVDGQPIAHSSELLKGLQERRVHVVVERDPQLTTVGTLALADKQFILPGDEEKVQKLVQAIGSGKELKTLDSFVLLDPITPKTQIDMMVTDELRAEYKAQVEVIRERIGQIEDPNERSNALDAFEKNQKKLLLGFAAADRKIRYNPPPTTLFGDVFGEIVQTLSALVAQPTRILDKMSGPVGIVHGVQQQSRGSLLEALYWLGLISLNLGVLNLLPIPMLDGGTIVFSILELFSGKRLKPKTMERLIVPFAFLLLTFFVYVTFNDISRIFFK